MDNRTLTGVPGVKVGHVTDADAMTGVTVMTFPEPNVAVVDVRGGGPGTRELGVLGEAIKPITVNALVFSGGSAFGLAAANGVVSELESDGRGVETPAGRVPIVPSAIVFDLMVGRADVRPTADDGAEAYRVRTADPVDMGSVGAGTGVTIGQWHGIDAVRNSGIGSYAIEVDGGVVSALVVLNAVGSISDGWRPGADGPEARLGPQFTIGFAENTSLIAIATDAGVTDRNELRRVAISAHDGLAATVVPSHTRYDGDTAFVVSSGVERPDADIDAIAEAAFRCVCMSIRLAVEHA
jgi:L-aminopeptidase/D-esterase-like protein